MEIFKISNPLQKEPELKEKKRKLNFKQGFYFWNTIMRNGNKALS